MPTLDEPGATNPRPSTGKDIKRRGLMAAAWAAVVGLVLARTTQKAEAASASVMYATDGLGSPINSVSSTVFVQSAASFNPNPGRYLLRTESYAHGVGGMSARVIDAFGLHGEIGDTDYSTFPYPPNQSANTRGVEGVNGSNGAGSIGVLGQIVGSSSPSSIAVYGVNSSTYAGPSPGGGGFGVYGISAKGHGLVGATATAGAAAVVGATNGVANSYAAAFYGPVLIGGALTVIGGAKSAAVPHPDGSHRRLYCVESPESWFEDFGKGQLDCGQAAIAIDPDFAATVNLDDYHVFLTGYDEFDLRVSEQTAAGFLVTSREPTAKGRFSWRLVARRKDIAGPRFERVTIPQEPVLPDLPRVTEMAPRQ